MASRLPFVLALIAALCIGQLQAQCDMTIDDLDKCAQDVTTFGNHNFVVPTNEQELDASCDKSKKGFQCMGRYVKKCMGPFAQTMFGVMQYDAKKSYNQRCVDPNGRKEFLKHIQCGKEKKNMEPLHICVDNYVSQIDYITNKATNKEDQLGGMCCSVLQLHKCFVTKTGEICDKVTGPETKEYFDRTFTASISEGMDYTCSQYRNLDMCKANLKAEVWEPLFKIGEDAAKEHQVSRFHSPITVMMKMFAKMN